MDSKHLSNGPSYCEKNAVWNLASFVNAPSRNPRTCDKVHALQAERIDAITLGVAHSGTIAKPFRHPDRRHDDMVRFDLEGSGQADRHDSDAALMAAIDLFAHDNDRPPLLHFPMEEVSRELRHDDGARSWMVKECHDAAIIQHLARGDSVTVSETVCEANYP